MPEIKGKTLRAIVRGLAKGDPHMTRSYSLTRLMQVFLQVTQAMAYAHSVGVVHSDLKPANIMLGEHGEVLVLDWGLSRVVVDGAVRTDLAAGYGDTGKALRSALASHGCLPSHIVELHPGRIGNHIQGALVVSPDALTELMPRKVIVSVAGLDARTRIRRVLEGLGLEELRDFVVAA